VIYTTQTFINNNELQLTMKEKILEETGLSKNETKVFLSLLELGLSTAGKIAEKSAIHRTNAYDALERLIEKGLVAYVIKKKVKLFEATDPKILINILKEKENKLESIMPQLLLSQQMAKSKSEAHIYEGTVAVRNMLNHFLELGQTRYVYGVPIHAHKMLGDGFLTSYHRKRAVKKLEVKEIYNSDAKERRNTLNKLSYTEAKYLPEEYDSPVATSICGDEVVMTLYSQPTLTIQIKNVEIAKAYKKYFNLLWKIAKE